MTIHKNHLKLLELRPKTRKRLMTPAWPFQKEHTPGGIWILPLGSFGCPIITLYHHDISRYVSLVHSSHPSPFKIPGLCRWRRCWRRHGRCHGRRCWSKIRCRHGMRRRHRHGHRRDANFLLGLVHLKVQFAWQVSYVKPCHLTWANRMVFWKVELNVPFNRMSWCTDEQSLWSKLLPVNLVSVQVISWGEYGGGTGMKLSVCRGLQAGAKFCCLTLLSCVWHVTWGTHCHILLIFMAAILPINRCGISVIESSMAIFRPSTPIETSP